MDKNPSMPLQVQVGRIVNSTHLELKSRNILSSHIGSSHAQPQAAAGPGCGTSKHTQVEPRAAIPGVDRHPHARRTLSHRPLHAVADEQVIPADPCRGGALELQSLSFLKIRTMLLLSISGDDDSDERGWRARLACIPASFAVSCVLMDFRLPSWC